VITYPIDSALHLALVRGNPAGREGVVVRVQTRCTFGDVFGSTACDCGRVLKASLRRLSQEDVSVLVYLNQSNPPGAGRMTAHTGEEAPLARAEGLRAPWPQRHRRADPVSPDFTPSDCSESPVRSWRWRHSG
jgi:hypothetical protein